MNSTSYSHGLEKIYAFETVNPNTVRSLHIQQETIKPVQVAIPSAARETQLLFSFVPQLPSLHLKEPIEVLQLTTFTQKGLTTLGKKTIEEVLELMNSIDSSFKGLGQGHIDEIQSKLKSYLEPSSCIDFSALCRILCHPLDPKERSILQASCGLQSLFSIAPSEIQEVQRWPSSQKQQVLHRAIEKINTQVLLDTLKQITDAYLISWIQERCGCITTSDFEECLQGLSREPSLFKGTLQLLKLVCGQIALPDFVLHPIESDIYAASNKKKQEFVQVRQKALSYFYDPFAAYPLATLCRLIKTDFARQWIGFEEGFIEKVLTMSHDFVCCNQQITRAVMW